MPRPRDPRVDAKILHATRRLLERDGVERLTVEAIAAEAGVGKPAFYRRYANKEQVVLSLGIAESVPAEPIDTGTFAGDIVALTDQLRASLQRMPRNVAGPQLGMAIADQAASRTFLENMAHPAIELMEQMWRRGISRGEVDPQLDFMAAKIALGTSVIFGVLLYRLEPGGPEIDQVVRQWIAGVRPGGAAPLSA